MAHEKGHGTLHLSASLGCFHLSRFRVALTMVRIDSPQAVAGPIRCWRDETKKSARQAVRRSGAEQVLVLGLLGKARELQKAGARMQDVSLA
ncbi:hypothetical protein M440DRAFT_1397647 [Trichoderma longibrachiatum ATCC 18648]|uniref:Uncharacterized protein n=1 Tax=Trichoderma longibrachiatum ATCC 18648 TaxID=983965 RepID=A0A2T4CFI2_TRILO|nr:hypothetical protein M440DRAFT_1397647 [Trichoderma longibrachiatum ATCC 18648]